MDCGVFGLWVLFIDFVCGFGLWDIFLGFVLMVLFAGFICWFCLWVWFVPQTKTPQTEPTIKATNQNHKPSP